MKRIVVTGADKKFFILVINLIGSIYVHEPDIAKIHVYDLGLTRKQRLFLSLLKKVVVKNVPAYCPHYLDVPSFAWKPAAINKSLTYNTALLWLDAGVELQTSIKDLFDEITIQGFLFNVTPLDEPNCYISTLTHSKCLEIINVKKSEVQNKFMINAGVMGYLWGHSSNVIVTEALSYAAVPEAIRGSTACHRHDQSIFSIMRVRYGLPAKFWMFYIPELNKWPFMIRAFSEDKVVTRNELEVVAKPYKHFLTVSITQAS